MTRLVKANCKISHNPDNEMRDTGRKTIFGDPILVRAQKYIEPGQFFDLDVLDSDTQKTLLDGGLVLELTELELALHEKIESSKASVAAA